MSLFKGYVFLQIQDSNSKSLPFDHEYLNRTFWSENNFYKDLWQNKYFVSFFEKMRNNKSECFVNTKSIHYPHSKLPWNKEQNKREIKIKDKDMVFSKHSLSFFYGDVSFSQ